MLLEELRKIDTSTGSLRKFGISVGIVLGLIGGYLFLAKISTFQYFLYVAGTLLLSGLTLPVILKPLYIVWMTFAVIMGWIMTRIILIILYYVVVTPIGLFMKLTGKKMLNMVLDKSQDSYWEYRDHPRSTKEEYERQF